MTSPSHLLRPAEVTDIDAITDVWYSGWREAHLGHLPEALLAHRSRRQFRERVPQILATTTVACADGQVAGLVVTTRDEIEQLYVAAHHRGTGLASALLRHGESVIATEFSTAFLAVIAGNPRARRFYERERWRDTGLFEYHAWTSDGERVDVPCHRYEKDLVGGEPA